MWLPACTSQTDFSVLTDFSVITALSILSALHCIWPATAACVCPYCRAACRGEGARAHAERIQEQLWVRSAECIMYWGLHCVGLVKVGLQGGFHFDQNVVRRLYCQWLTSFSLIKGLTVINGVTSKSWSLPMSHKRSTLRAHHLEAFLNWYYFEVLHFLFSCPIWVSSSPVPPHVLVCTCRRYVVVQWGTSVQDELTNSHVVTQHFCLDKLYSCWVATYIATSALGLFSLSLYVLLYAAPAGKYVIFGAPKAPLYCFQF